MEQERFLRAVKACNSARKALARLANARCAISGATKGTEVEAKVASLLPSYEEMEDILSRILAAKSAIFLARGRGE